MLMWKYYSLSPDRLFATPGTEIQQAPLSIEFPRQEYWGGLPFPSPGDLPNPWIEPGLLHCRQILYLLSRQGSPLICYVKLLTDFVFSMGQYCAHAQSLSHDWPFGTPWTVAHQALLSMGFSKQEYWSGSPFPPPGNFPDLEIKSACPTSPTMAGRCVLYH